MPVPDGEGVKKSPKIVKIVRDRVPAGEEGTWDNIDYGNYKIGISKADRCGQKPNGEEVSISLGYATGLQTGQTVVWTWKRF
jgi:hypothetical protein